MKRFSIVRLLLITINVENKLSRVNSILLALKSFILLFILYPSFSTIDKKVLKDFVLNFNPLINRVDCYPRLYSSLYEYVLNIFNI